jgi:nicotinate-nucleotide adenylyltransferase
MVEYTDMDQLWFVISPQNPLKKKKSLLNDYERLVMLEYAVEEDDRFAVCDVEFRMPKPSYTVDTLAYLHELHPAHEFVLIIGSDSLLSFHKWKNARIIEENYVRYVYPRPGFKMEKANDKNIVVVDAPLIEISSTFIREGIRNKHNLKYFLPPKVYDYILKMNFYS